MMSARKIIPLLALAALIAILAIPAHGQTGIIVQNADSIRQEGVRLDGGLSSVTGRVGPRIVLQYANTKREERIAAPPSALQILFAQVPPRIVLEYANTARHERVVAPPAALQTLFGQVAPRIILQYANTSRQVALAYPAALINDRTPPVIGNVQTQLVSGGFKVTWTTDEFATGEVRYGTAAGSYGQVVSDPLYEKQHSLTLIGLTPGTRYYFVVAGADRNGNRSQSREYPVVVQTKTYLPLIRRR